MAGADGTGFADRWAEVAPALHAWATLRFPKRLRSRLDPDDVVQEVCCRAFLGIGRFDPARGEFRGWVFGIANHVVQAALTEFARSPTCTRPAVLDESTRFLDRVPDEATAISRRLARDESFRRFLELAVVLDEDERRLLVFRGLEGLSHDDVAKELGVSADVCRKRWERLRARLAGMVELTGVLAD